MVNDLILLESVMDSLTGRQKDPSLLVRVLALRGLGNIAVGAPEKVGANGTELVGSSGAGLGGEGGAYGGHCLLWEWGCWPRPHPGDGAVARPLRPTAVFGGGHGGMREKFLLQSGRALEMGCLVWGWSHRPLGVVGKHGDVVPGDAVSGDGLGWGSPRSSPTPMTR